MRYLYRDVFIVFAILSTFLTGNMLNAQHINPTVDGNNVMKHGLNGQNRLGSRIGEFIIDTSLVYIPEPDYQYNPKITFGDTQYFAVWQDARNDTTLNIIGTRVSLDGLILDPVGLGISAVDYNQVCPSIAFDGTNYLVVWSDWRSGWSDIYGTRVTQTGVVIDTLDIAICTAEYWQSYPSLVFGDTNYLVVWGDFRNSPGSDTNPDIYAARITPSGTVLDTHGIAVCTAQYKQHYPSVAFDGTNYLIVWQDLRNDTADIYGARVTQTGIVIDTLGLIISSAPRDQFEPEVVFGDTNYLVAWQDKRMPADDNVYGARITPGGVVLDTNGIPISTMNGPQLDVSVTFDGTNFVAVWRDLRSSLDSTDMYCARIDQAGAVLDPAGIPIATLTSKQYDPSVACGGPNYCIVWWDRFLENARQRNNIFGARVTTSGVVLDSCGFPIATTSNHQNNPTVAFDGSNYLCIWNDNRDFPDTANIYGLRITQTGSILDSVCFSISKKINAQYFPAITFDGLNYFTVWEAVDSVIPPYMLWGIYGKRINQSGIIIDTTEVLIGYSDFGSWHYHPTPDVVFGNPYYLVVWATSQDIYGARVSQDGEVIDTIPFTICSTIGDSYHPKVAFDGTNYFVTWECWAYAYEWDVVGARVNTSGTVLDPSGIPISHYPGYQMSPSAVFNGIQDYFVVWQDNRNGTWDIYGARVRNYGTVLDTAGIAICTAAGDQTIPVVSHDGTDYIVVWQDFRSGSNWDIYAAKVSTSGTVLNTYEVLTQPGDQITPALVRGNGDQILITYSGWADSINQHIAGSRRIWGKFYPFVGIEENALHPTLDILRSLQVYPNPVLKECKIKYFLDKKTKVHISIFDVTGRLIKEIAKESQNGGIYYRTIDMTDLTQGVYFIRLNTEDYSGVKKIIFIK